MYIYIGTAVFDLVIYLMIFISFSGFTLHMFLLIERVVVTPLDRMVYYIYI